ncbi:MAG: type IV pilus modification protein PilV [Gammaproteobacteria bacterium HGW-Gammaproteobacteria-8]|nr:MAG: type IV pilus modification protein PilV [Gammaproteobacteria bacterium HGW-Gammaproteobacteria-8]
MNPFKLSTIRHLRRQRGLTLIEILVTLLVLAVGLMGLAALQGFSLQAGQISYVRTQATNFAYEVADHARANRSVVDATGSIPNADFWNNRVAALLPGGTVTVTMTAAGITVTVTWTDDRETGDPASFTINTRI